MSAAPQSQSIAILRANAVRSSGTARIFIGHAAIDSCRFEQAQSAILEHASRDGQAAYVITPNAHHIVLLSGDRRLREIYSNADLVVPDGFSLLLAARLSGHAFPERITGVDLFESLCAAAASQHMKVFFLGGLPGSADLAAERLRQRNPELDVSTYCPPLGFERDPAELERVANLIRAVHPRILFAGLGAPKQEYWIYDHGRNLGVNVCVGIGGSFEMVAGVVKRAPRLVQKLGFEWLYRLCLEPRRLWRRYLIGNSQFIKIVISQRIMRLLVGALVHILKDSGVQAAPGDARACSEVIEILSRIVSADQAAAE